MTEQATLLFVCGAPGVGKSTLARALAQRANGQFIALDMDELLDDDGRLLGVTVSSDESAAIWPEYNRIWGRIGNLIGRSGATLVLFGPLTPKELAVAGFNGPVKFALLDCPDEVLQSRLEKRGWTEAAICAALADADEARVEIPTRISTDRSAEEALTELIDWIA